MKRLTTAEIKRGVELLAMIPRSNPTLSGMKIVINALNDYADEAKKIDEIELSDYLRDQANKLMRAADEIQKGNKA